MKKLAILLPVLLIICSSTKSDTPKERSYIAPGVTVKNLLVGRASNGYIDSRSSLVKVTDGCRVLYVMGGYLTSDNRVLVNDKSTVAVSDIDCKK